MKNLYLMVLFCTMLIVPIEALGADNGGKGFKQSGKSQVNNSPELLQTKNKSIPSQSYKKPQAMSFDFGVGAWYQLNSLGLDVNIDQLIANYLASLNIPSVIQNLVKVTSSINNNSNFHQYLLLDAHARMEHSIPSLPNVYILYSPLKFNGQTVITANVNVSSPYGSQSISQSMIVEMSGKLHMIDTALYWGMPYLETATNGWINIDLGLNIKTLVLPATGISSYIKLPLNIIPAPTLYGAITIAPYQYNNLALESEFRLLPSAVVAFFTNAIDISIYDLLGRVKYSVYNPAYVAAGYRYQYIAIGSQGINIAIVSQGPFAEAGVNF